MTYDGLHGPHIKRGGTGIDVLTESFVNSGSLLGISCLSARTMCLEELRTVVGVVDRIQASFRVCLADQGGLGICVGHCDTVRESILVGASFANHTFNMIAIRNRIA